MALRFNVIVITCPGLYRARISNIMENISELIELNLIENINIITAPDSELKKRYLHMYDSQFWDKDIQNGEIYFARNIISAINRNNWATVNDMAHEYGNILTNTVKTVFPARKLTNSEISVALRHIHAWHMISSLQNNTIVLEDDIIYNRSNESEEIMRSLDKIISTQKEVFVDLSDDYIPAILNFDSRKNNLSKIGQVRKYERYWKSFPIAFTRTLSAYVINPRVANRIIQGSRKFSLPIDMHLSIVLKELKIPGFCWIEKYPLFMHGSKQNSANSSVLQNGDFI